MRKWLLFGMLAASLMGTAAAAQSDTARDRGNDVEFLQDNPAGDDLLMSRESYFYSSFGRRDPFASLLSGKFASTGEGDLLDVGELTLVGVVWGEDDKFGMLQDSRGRAHVLRVGDRVVNGKVTEVTRSSLTVQHSFFGETANITIHMSQGDGDDQ